jgi:flagellar motor switch/type III secretory pathway protein FliN
MTVSSNNPGRARIQQLLAAIGSRHQDDTAKIEATDYDWHQPHFFSSRQIKDLAGFCEKSAVVIAQKFGILCQQGCEVMVSSLSEHFAGQFLGQESGAGPSTVPGAGQTQNPTNYYLPFGQVQSREGKPALAESCGFVSIPPNTALVWATQLLGDTEAKENTVRPLSELETSLLFDICSQIVQALAEASGGKVNFRITADNMCNRLPLELKGEEEFCKITLQIKKSDDSAGSECHILVLCEKLIPVLGDTEAAAKFSPKDITQAIQNHIETIAIPVTAQLASVPVTVEQLMSMAPGDILVLDKKIDDPGAIIVAGKTVCRGRLAKSAGKYAIVVTETLF